MNSCTAALSSLTYCMKAQRLLLSQGIKSVIVKLDPAMTRRGCAYGIEFSCQYKRDVRSILSREGIPPTQYVDEGGGAPI